jgi:UDP-3-O-[3-hydroxymyristoyl] N-acetylglucosamine deacetylase/3-hydroxyacyl-[acyl-carrier-protein] dehydratase
MKQHTIKASFNLEGIGLHTGQPVKMTVHPAPENHGFKFQRIDIEDAPIIPATADKVVSTNRSTVSDG